jgi:c-di-GMP-binding flagellar brake protein YcgR
MNEHRRAPRKTAYVTIPVTNMMTGESVGRIGNLSINGMLMVCERLIGDDVLVELGFELINADSVPQFVRIGAQEQWSERANVPGQYWCGLQFIDISPADLDVIESWLGEAND